jgi:hypothetical protein
MRTTAKAQTMNRPHPLLQLFLSAALSSLLFGCASYQVLPPSSDPDKSVSEYRKATVHGFWWQTTKVPSSSCRHGIDNLYVDDNLALDLVSVVTLGIWKPIDVRYQCRAPAAISDSPPQPGPWTNRTANAFFWGLWNDPQVIAANEAIDGFHDIKVADNLGYDLISVITLGIWKPMTVRYRCRPDPLL